MLEHELPEYSDGQEMGSGAVQGKGYKNSKQSLPTKQFCRGPALVTLSLGPSHYAFDYSGAWLGTRVSYTFAIITLTCLPTSKDILDMGMAYCF